MPESLYSDSPYLIVLSIITLALSCYFPVMIGKKMTFQIFPNCFRHMVACCILWNLCSLVGILIFSGPLETDSSLYTLRQCLFGIQALAWVNSGMAAYEIGELMMFPKINSVKTIYIAAASFFIMMFSIILIIDPSIIAKTEIFGLYPFAEHTIFMSFTLIYLLFLFPMYVAVIYQLVKGVLHTTGHSLAQTGIYMTGTFVFFVMLAFTFDIIIPLATHFSSWLGNFHFLIWHQFFCIFLAILCGQYYTSVAFQNKSSLWFLRKLVSKTDNGVIYYSEDGRINYANPGAIKILGLPSSNLQGKSIRSILPPNLNFFNEFVYNNLQMDINGERHSIKIHFLKVRQSLTTFFYVAFFSDQTKTVLLQNEIKNLNDHYAEYTHDLIRFQNRLSQEAKIKFEKESILNTLINALPFRVWYKNELGVYQKQNQLDINDQGSLEGITDVAEKISIYEKKARELGEAAVHTSYVNDNGEEISQDESNRLSKDGTKVKTYDNMYIPILQGNAPYKTLCIKVDMTEQRHLEQERNMLREQKFIHSRLEELGTMCGAFAHDYNNILASQIGFCQLAQEMLPKDHQANMFISEALKAAERGKTSLEELLNAIRGNATKATPAIVFSPYMVIEDVVKKISLTLPQNIEVDSQDIDHNIKIRGIVASLDRIISNLANNAIFAMKATGGKLSFALHRTILQETLITPYAPPIPAGTYAQFDISDTGTGMDSNTLERIFAPFFTTKAPGEGLGLGLSSALRLLKEGNAYFTVHTTLGKGTTFNLYWPLETDPKEK
ncbi:MAG: PAS domain S-box protein [Fibrobacter sp.]|nr:PAS domain S-box protein [Fibrobacter sp.]